ncbi:hypothetical protein [Stenotrophomonas sp.]|uniref:hypothetical protein n=1 Tax=Stenotrophomonas sp. TaxID=69392 RepID=UPI00289E130E|nr:hypothetical protein [Stenotrophomonas sp.]
MADIEQQARQMLAAEYAQLGYSKRLAESPGACRMSEAAVRVIATALCAAPDCYAVVPLEPTDDQVEQGELQVQAVLDALGTNARAQTLAMVAYDGMIAGRPAPVTLATVKPPRDMRVRVPAVAEIRECTNG